MNIVTVNVGGRTIPVQVQTYNFGDQSLSASVEAGIVAVAESVAAAETAEVNAEAAAALAAVYSGNASTAATEAEFARDEAAAYAAAIPPDVTYATDAAGRTGVGVDGGLYWLRTTDGLRLKERLTSSTSGDITVSGNPVIIFSLNGIYQRFQFIKCTVTALGANNNYTITPVDASIRYSGGGTQYVWEWEAPAVNDQGSGSVAVTIKDGAGNTFITANLHKRGNVALTGSEFQAGDLLSARRQTAGEDVGQRLLWMAPPNSAVREIAPLVRALDTFGKRPSVSRPLHYYKSGIDQHVIRMRLTEEKYATGQSRRSSDMIQVVEHDMSTFQADSGNCLSLNSIFSHVRGRDCHDLSLMFDALSGGVTVDTGQVPTTLETPVIGGKFGDAVGLYTISGAGHGYLVDPESTLTTTLTDASTSGLPVAGSIDPDADIGTAFYGDKIVKVMTAKSENAAHDIYCRPTWTVTYDPAATNQIVFDMEWDFTDADVTVTPGFLRGFANLFAGTDLDRCQPFVNGVAGAVTVIDKRDNSDTILTGHPEKVIFWHSDFPEKQIVVTNLFGYGVPYKINGVDQPDTSNQTYIDNFDWGVKLYMNPFGDQTATTPVDATGKVYTSSTGIRFQIADPIT